MKHQHPFLVDTQTKMAAPKTRYVEMSEKLYDEISARVRVSYPNSCIIWIEENLNPELRAAYEARKAVIAAECGGNPREVQFFHGTSENVINSIAIGGFDPSKNKTAAYGIGTYFAKDASYSFSYMRPGKEDISYMFLCDVLLGKPTSGFPNRGCPDGFHSQVNNPAIPTIASVPWADSAYPKYIIAFHKSAR
jgi:hypothetical protein